SDDEHAASPARHRTAVPAALAARFEGRITVFLLEWDGSGGWSRGTPAVDELGRDQPHDVRLFPGLRRLDPADELAYRHPPEPVGCALDRRERQRERARELVGVAADDGQIRGCAQPAGVQY